MKNLIVVLAISSVLSTPCFGQIVGIRPNAGGNFANMNSQNAQGNTNTGLNGGLGFDIALTRSGNGYPIRLSPEIFVRQNGSNDFVNQSNFSGFQSLDLTYVGLYLPLTIAIGPEEGETLFQGVMLQFNSFFDYAVVSNANTLNGSLVTNPFNRNIGKFDFGLGVNIQFHSAQYGGIAIGYNWGLHNIAFADNTSNQIFAKNRGLFINAVATLNTH